MVNKSSVKDKGDDPYIWTLSDISISNTVTETNSNTTEENVENK